VRNSTDFVSTLDYLHVGHHNMMVNFHVVSPFTRVLIKMTMDLLGWHFKEDILRLPPHLDDLLL
jgi:hypothetical protein